MAPELKGTKTERAVQRRLFVSFHTVMMVAAQGQWKRKKIIVQRAVVFEKPFAEKSAAVSEREPSSARPPPEYPIAIIGRAISFAGRERTNPERIFPSRPKILAKGSRKSAQILRIEASPTYMFAESHKISPHGIAVTTALASTKRVLSNTERVITLRN